MRKKIIYPIFIISFFTGCSSQNTNPKYIGDDILDLDKITFQEKIDTLLDSILE